MSFPFKKNAEILRAMNQELNASCDEENKDPERYLIALNNWHDNYDQLAFPGGLKAGIKRLRNHDLEVVNDVIDFLESDLYFFRSGYTIVIFLQQMKHISLTSAQQIRLKKLILQSINGGIRNQIKHYDVPCKT